MTEAANVPEGLVIEGRYRIVRRIAEGGMATVYQATDERLERTVAIKIMHIQLAQGPQREQYVERFHREAKSAAAIANPHVVQVYDTGEFNGMNYLVMEYVHGVNLRHEMNEQHTFTVRETLRILSETLNGLSAAHRLGVVHRDIKPENIMLNDRGRVQITDFGLAKATSQATLSATGMLLGTAAYLAPEMIEHNQATPQGDLYSVGITAWEMLAGESPFKSDNPVTLVFKHVHEDVPSLTESCPGIDPGVAAYIGHLTARAVEDRPSDAADALRELRTLTASLPIPAWQYRKPASSSTPKPTADQPGPMAAAPMPPVRQSEATEQPATATAVLDGPSDATAAHDAPADAVSTETAAATSAIPSFLSSPAFDSASASATSPLPSVDAAATTAFNPDATQVIDRAPADDTMALATTEHGIPGAAGADDHAPSPTHGSTKKRTAIIVAVVLALIAVLGGGAFAWWYFRGPGSYWTLPQPNDITCTEGEACPITNANWKDYEAALTVATIPYTVTEDFSDTVADGDIISTDPANVGDHVSKRDGESVTVTVSKGVKQATIPDDILDPTSDAGKDPLQALKNAGFSNIKHGEDNDQYSETAPSGAALSISPDPGTTLDHNEQVTITLSKGPMPVTMPTVEGISRDDLESTFADLKLTANITEEFSDSVPSGDVISASAEPGTELHWGDSVDVVVSKGPETVAVPSGLVGKQESEVTRTLEKLGFDVETNRILGGLFGTVRDVQYNGTSISDGADVRLRDTNGNPTVITLTVV